MVDDVVTLSIACVDGLYWEEKYGFVVELSVDATLAALAALIVDTVGFEDTGHLDKFYLAGAVRRGGHLALIHDADNGVEMSLHLEQVFALPKEKKLYYVFDFADCWLFKIVRLGNHATAKPGVQYPRLVSETGSKPDQYGDEDWDGME